MTPPRDPAATARLLRRASLASVVVASGLILLKAGAYVRTDSVSLLSSLIDSLLDLAASTVNAVALRHALTPADREHRFGHGKAEPLAGLGQAAFVAGSAALLLVEAVRRLVEPRAIQNAEIGVAVMAIGIVATAALVLYQRRVARATGSVAIGADALHYQTDLMVNAAVIAALVLDRSLGAPWLDPAFALAIGLYILWSAGRIVGLSVAQLMDRELPDAERARIRAIAEGHPAVRAVHDLKTRAAGPQIFIQLHLDLDADMTLSRAHDVSQAVEDAILAAFPHAEVIIHQDPAVTNAVAAAPGVL